MLNGTPYVIDGVNWLRAGNLTPIIIRDTQDRLANETGATFREVAAAWEHTLALMEETYGVEVYLTGQVFTTTENYADAFLADEFWQDFVQELVCRTRQTLEQ